MKALRSRRGGIVVIAAGVTAVVAAGAFCGFQLATRPTIAAASPGPNGAVATRNPSISVTLAHADGLHGLRVAVDGRPTHLRSVGAGRIVVPTRGLAQGRHTVEVSFNSENVFARRVARSWDFVVDTTRPQLALRGPEPYFVSGGRVVRFHGRGEAGARVAVSWPGGTVRGRVSAAGAWRVRARLPEGSTTASVIATDRAGNTTATRRVVIVDTVGPLLQVTPPGEGEPLTITDEPTIYGTVGRDLAGRLTFGAKVNGRSVGPIGMVDATEQSTETPALPEGARGAVTVDGRAFRITVGKLPQGRSDVEIWARDRAGNVSERTFPVMVDSTERLGQYTLVQGARGADVTELQERLAEARVYRKKTPSGVFDAATRKAVALYQRRHELGADGVVGPRTIRTLVGRIVINLSQYRLRLIRNGEVAASYPVAIGQTAFPTPLGKFRIVMMTTDPTWIPPDSPWAKGLGPIPPGPGNPLGTRWIGTSADAVGIHGTPAGYTIGSRASHGCIRMHIPDVEKLYEEVTMGMEVDIRP
jgi:lipoprotein-anchoring transpeptidase ErfK/SrfK